MIPSFPTLACKRLNVMTSGPLQVFCQVVRKQLVTFLKSETVRRDVLKNKALNRIFKLVFSSTPHLLDPDKTLSGNLIMHK